MYVERTVRMGSALGLGLLLLAQGAQPAAALQEPVQCFILDQGCINDSVRQDRAFVLTNGPGDVVTDDEGRPFTDREAAIAHLASEVPEPPTVADGQGAITFASPFEEFGFSGEAQLQCWRDVFIFSVPGERRQIRWLRVVYRDRSLSPLEVLDLLPTEGEWVVPVMSTTAPLDRLYRTGHLPDLSEQATPLPVPLSMMDLQASSEWTAAGAVPYESLRLHRGAGRANGTLHGVIGLHRTPDGVVVATTNGILPGTVQTEGENVRTFLRFGATFRVRPDSSCG